MQFMSNIYAHHVDLLLDEDVDIYNMTDEDLCNLIGHNLSGTTTFSRRITSMSDRNPGMDSMNQINVRHISVAPVEDPLRAAQGLLRYEVVLLSERVHTNDPDYTWFDPKVMLATS